MFACSRSPTKNASPSSCKASTTELCSFNSPSLLYNFSEQSLEGYPANKEIHPILVLLDFLQGLHPSYFSLFFHFFIPKQLVQLVLFFLSLICLALSLFSSLNFCMSAIFLSPASLALSFFAFSPETFMVLAISNNRRWS